MANSWFNKSHQIEIAQELTDPQRHHIKVATELGYTDQQISMKLKIPVGDVYAYVNCLNQGWQVD